MGLCEHKYTSVIGSEKQEAKESVKNMEDGKNHYGSPHPQLPPLCSWIPFLKKLSYIGFVYSFVGHLWSSFL